MTASKSTKEALCQDAHRLGRNELERAVLTALALFQNEYTVDARCPMCGSVIVVTGHKGGLDHFCAWATSCQCGKCNTDFRGL